MKLNFCIFCFPLKEKQYLKYYVLIKLIFLISYFLIVLTNFNTYFKSIFEILVFLFKTFMLILSSFSFYYILKNKYDHNIILFFSKFNFIWNWILFLISNLIFLCLIFFTNFFNSQFENILKENKFVSDFEKIEIIVIEFIIFFTLNFWYLSLSYNFYRAAEQLNNEIYYNRANTEDKISI